MQHGRTDTTRQPQIVAIGGSSFNPALGSFPLLRYTLDLAGVERPKVCLIPTAGGENAESISAFYDASEALRYVPSWLSLFDLPTADLRAYLLAQDLIFVGGGNTKSMLALWREWELDTILREAWQRGIVLAGVSAGSICWFEQGITDSIPGPLTPLKCLGFLAGSNCPHFDGERERRPTFHRLLREGTIMPGYAADDNVGIHFIGDRLERVVSAKAQSTAYRLELVDGEVLETPLVALIVAPHT